MSQNVARSALRALIPSVASSSHITITAASATESPLAQGKIIATLLKQLTSRSSTSSYRVASRENGFSRYFVARALKTPFSSLSAFATVTASSRRSTKFYSNYTMAAASPIFLKRDFSSAALQPQVDALDESVDPIQRQLLEEQCIVLNDKDQVIGHDTKRNCHRIINGDVLLHRAFSVFLFNGKGELLLQQRSKTKITFPMMWTNTCCSHPLYTPSELEEKESIGVRRAARRRLEIELGIPQDSISLDDFQYLTRIHYKALSDSIWGEHEIDYILFLQKNNLQIQPNPDEIEEIRWVTLDKVKEMVATEKVSLTPWFDLILKSDLPQWWGNLETLKQFEDHEKIHRM